MSVPLELRAAVRERFLGCCGYCGMSETDVGNQLEIDHYRPRVAGGGNELDNLVYTCPACNRYKSDYWPGEDALEAVQLLNPNRDTLELHRAETVSGRLVGLTQRGWFHLNRQLLVVYRQQRQRAHLVADALTQAHATSVALQERIEILERDRNNQGPEQPLQSSNPPTCRTDQYLSLMIRFPNCLAVRSDGTPWLDSYDHRRHMAYAEANAPCPSSHATGYLPTAL